MTQYKHRITLIVPEQHMDIANHLALIMGESTSDISTFVTADWQDSEGNLYSVCSAASKPVVLGALTKGLPAPLPPHATAADVTKAQQALGLIILYDVGVMAGVDKIILAVDTHPQDTFESTGLVLVPESLVEPKTPIHEFSQL